MGLSKEEREKIFSLLIDAIIPIERGLKELRELAKKLRPEPSEKEEEEDQK